MVKLIVFDLDGTLIDSRRDLAGAVNFVRSTMGLEPLSVERVVSFVGNGISTLIRRALADADADFDTALERMRKYYAYHLVESTCLYEGVSAGLKELSECGIKLAVLSNKDGVASRKILEALGVAGRFCEIVGGDADFPMKPDPAAINALMAKYGVAREECWIIGDNWTDLAAGRNAGIRRVYAAYGFGEKEDEKEDFEVQSFAEFVMAIRRF